MLLKFLYRNCKQRNKAMNSGDYTMATSCFKKAIKKNAAKAKAYSGLAQVLSLIHI